MSSRFEFCALEIEPLEEKLTPDAGLGTRLERFDCMATRSGSVILQRIGCTLQRKVLYDFPLFTTNSHAPAFEQST